MTETRHDIGVDGDDDVRALLDRWASAGLLDETQVERIRAFEGHRAFEAAPTTAGGPPVGPVVTHPSTTSPGPRLVVEALAYLGGALALGAALLLVQLVWPDLSTAGRLAVPGAATAALLTAGALLPGGTGELQRLRSAFWLLSAGAWAATLAVLGDQALDLVGHDTALLVGLGSAAYTLALYLRDTDALQHLALLASLAATGAAVGARAHWDEATLVGLGIWTVAASWSVAGEFGYLPPRAAARYGSAVLLIAGALAMSFSLGGQVLAAVTLAWLFGLGIRQGSVGLLAVAAFGTLQLIPSTVQYFFPDNTRVAVPVLLLSLGAVLVGVAVTVSRRRQRTGPRIGPGQGAVRRG